MGVGNFLPCFHQRTDGFVGAGGLREHYTGVGSGGGGGGGWGGWGVVVERGQG